MTTHNTRNSEKKSPMTMTLVARSTEMYLLHEALSRARMSQPLHEASHGSSEGARRVAMRARAQQARDLGEVSQSANR